VLQAIKSNISIVEQHHNFHVHTQSIWEHFLSIISFHSISNLFVETFSVCLCYRSFTTVKIWRLL